MSVRKWIIVASNKDYGRKRFCCIFLCFLILDNVLLDGTISFSVVASNRLRGKRHKLRHRKFHLNVRKNFYTVRLEQAAQRGWGVSFSGDSQNPLGCDPGQPAPGEPALAEQLHSMIYRDPFQHQWWYCESAILWLYSPLTWQHRVLAGIWMFRIPKLGVSFSLNFKESFSDLFLWWSFNLE